MQEQSKEIKWTGWIVKSAIEEEIYLEDRRLDQMKEGMQNL